VPVAPVANAATAHLDGLAHRCVDRGHCGRRRVVRRHSIEARDRRAGAGGRCSNPVAVALPPVAESLRPAPQRASSQVAAAPNTAPSAELSAGGGVSDLSDNDLRALLQDLESMDAVTPTDPEPVTVRVSTPGRGGAIE
jgi:hypothetical protein